LTPSPVSAPTASSVSAEAASTPASAPSAAVSRQMRSHEAAQQLTERFAKARNGAAPSVESPQPASDASRATSRLNDYSGSVPLGNSIDSGADEDAQGYGD